ncbi:hypothetical protein HA402_002432 [Bradysia odoriphaga]|nr:hypothetical protein HA402_002432 [Bradysia odoriphaga]
MKILEKVSIHKILHDLSCRILLSLVILEYECEITVDDDFPFVLMASDLQQLRRLLMKYTSFKDNESLPWILDSQKRLVYDNETFMSLENRKFFAISSKAPADGIALLDHERIEQNYQQFETPTTENSDENSLKKLASKTLQQLRGLWWPAYSHRNCKSIIKSPASARVTGIKVVNQWSQIPKLKPLIVQRYIDRPLLIAERKFDLRLYVLVTPINPLRVYMHTDGLARFVSVKYSAKSDMLNHRHMHLTNYSRVDSESNVSDLKVQISDDEIDQQKLNGINNIEATITIVNMDI